MDSNSLISTLYKNDKTKSLLLELIKKFLQRQQLNELTFDYDILKKKDHLIYQYFIKLNKNSNSTPMNSRNRKRFFDLIFFLKYSQHKDIKINKYLDIGCFDGSNTLAVGNGLKLDPMNIYGVDVQSYSGMKIKPKDGFQFIQYDGANLPFPDNTFDCISMFQVYHHVTQPVPLLRDIVRVLKPNGLLFIREHDKSFPLMSYLIRLEHILYSILIDKVEYNTFIYDYYEHYYSKKELVKRFEKFGFKECETTKPKDITDNPTNYYNALFQLEK
jgi:ubiquinone/menaquinone biosynthesis C-methylase UbiE